ncbi:MAG: hypothetical protein MUC49_10625 [Raineya sp.]|jgi:uncharacterized protein YxjI|nr:hypothetical protein [Raineya sp.]
MPLQYPLHLDFKIATLASDFSIKDNAGNAIAFVRQKIFKLKEDVVVFNNESRSQELFRIKANKWLDFNTTYNITTKDGQNVGKVGRKGMRSIWKATYDIFDQNDQHLFTVQEANAWVKVMDAVAGEIPILNIFTGYLFNPKYLVQDKSGKVYFELKKQPSFFGRKFKLEKITDIDDSQEGLINLALMMIVLLERYRG